MKYLKLPKKTTVYVKGKKYSDYVPATKANLIPESILKKISESDREVDKVDPGKEKAPVVEDTKKKEMRTQGSKNK